MDNPNPTAYSKDIQSPASSHSNKNWVTVCERTDKRTDKLTNERTDRWSDLIMPQILFGGIKKEIYVEVMMNTREIKVDAA